MFRNTCLAMQSDFTVAFLAAERPGQVVQSARAGAGCRRGTTDGRADRSDACLRAGKAAEKVKKIFNDTKRYVVLFIHIDVSGK